MLPIKTSVATATETSQNIDYKPNSDRQPGSVGGGNFSAQVPPPSKESRVGVGPQQSIQKQLNFIIMVTSLGSLLLAVAAFMVYDWISYRNSLVREMTGLAKLVGRNSVALLEFKDAQEGKEMLSSLEADSRVVAAALYDKERSLFSTFSRSGRQDPFLYTPRRDGVYFEKGTLLLFQAIQNEGERLGTLFIHSTLKDLETRFKQYAVLSGGILVISGLLAFFMSSRLQRRISGPILALTKTVNRISDHRDFSVRGVKQNDDEIGLLVERFNEMVDQIQRSDRAIQEANDVLEHRVTVRTRDLKEEIQRRSILENELVQAKEEAEQGSRAKTEFLSRMSHELRTPLNAILGFSQVLTAYSKDPLTDTQKEYVAFILTSANHLLELINEILDLSSIELGRINMEIINVSIPAVVDETISCVAPLAKERGVTIENRIEPGQDLYFRADAVRLKQVLLNLVSNAVKYNHKGGRVILTLEKPTQKMGRVRVEDTGHGIPQEEMENLFQPFNRLGAQGTEVEGTGIGLTITKNLVELMNGELTLESEVGKGSSFTIQLPLGQPGSSSANKGAPGDASSGGASTESNQVLTLLYVEDNPFNLKLVESILRHRPQYELMSAKNAEMGLEMARAHRPDLILMDINLPGMNGVEAMDQLKSWEETCEIPVVALSADAMKEHIDDALKRGFQTYLTKPLNIESLFKVLDEMMIRKQF